MSVPARCSAVRTERRACDLARRDVARATRVVRPERLRAACALVSCPPQRLVSRGRCQRLRRRLRARHARAELRRRGGAAGAPRAAPVARRCAAQRRTARRAAPCRAAPTRACICRGRRRWRRCVEHALLRAQSTATRVARAHLAVRPMRRRRRAGPRKHHRRRAAAAGGGQVRPQLRHAAVPAPRPLQQAEDGASQPVALVGLD